MGGGSSFSKREYNSKAQNMEIESRWEVFANNDKYLELIKDREIWELYEKIFDKVKGVQKLKDKLGF